METPVTIFRNQDVEEVLLGAPAGHRHLRIALKTTEGTLVFHEATIANIVRAYVTLKTHPTKRALRLRQKELVGKKSGFDAHQLMEEDEKEQGQRSASQIESALAALLGGS